MCLPAHSRETVAARGGPVGGSDREVGSSVAESPAGAGLASQNDALVALGAVFLLLAMGFSAIGSDPWSSNPGTVRAEGALGWVVRLAGGAALAAAILLKQFALAAIPSLLVLVMIRSSRRGALQAALVGALVLMAGFVPFLAASPMAVWRDTVGYGNGTFHVVSYGLSGVLVRMGVVGRHSTGYPFFGLVALVWLPITAYLTSLQYRSQVAWTGGAAFTVSIFVLITIARVFQESYIIYPLSGLIIGLLLALDERGRAAVAR